MLWPARRKGAKKAKRKSKGALRSKAKGKKSTGKARRR
jgi:hypothetical protein